MNDWQTTAAALLWERYDLLKFVMPHYEEVHIRMRDELRSYAGRHPYSSRLEVLDIGCGSGVTALQALEADMRFHVKAVDDSSGAIEAAQMNLSAYADRIGFTCVEMLSFLRLSPDCSFHAVVSGYALHNLESEYRKSVLHECYRVLKPDGVFINADIVGLGAKEENQKELVDRLNKLRLFRKIGRDDLHVAWTNHYEADEATKLGFEEQSRLLQRCGFVEVKYIWQDGFDSLCIATKKIRQVFVAMPFGSKSFAELTKERQMLHEVAQRYGIALVEQFVGVENEPEYSDRSYDPAWVIEKDKYFIQQADLVIADFRGASIGRDMEVALAKELYHKVVVVIVDDSNIRTSFWLRRFSDYVVSSINEAFMVAKKTTC